MLVSEEKRPPNVGVFCMILNDKLLAHKLFTVLVLLVCWSEMLETFVNHQTTIVNYQTKLFFGKVEKKFLNG